MSEEREPITERTLPPCCDEGCEESALYTSERGHLCLRHARRRKHDGERVWLLELPDQNDAVSSAFGAQIEELERVGDVDAGGAELELNCHAELPAEELPFAELGVSDDVWPWERPS